MTDPTPVIAATAALVGTVLESAAPSDAMHILGAVLKAAPDVAKLIAELRHGIADDSHPIVQQLDAIFAAGDETASVLHDTVPPAAH